MCYKSNKKNLPEGTKYWTLNHHLPPQKAKKSTSDEGHHTDRFHTGNADAVRGHPVFSQQPVNPVLWVRPPSGVIESDRSCQALSGESRTRGAARPVQGGKCSQRREQVSQNDASILKPLVGKMIKKEKSSKFSLIPNAFQTNHTIYQTYALMWLHG